MRPRLLVACAVALLLPVPAHGESACRPVASFELATDWYGGVYLPVRIGELHVKLLVDSGGTLSMLTDSTVAALGLTPQPVRSRMVMFGGEPLTRSVTVGDVQIGNMVAQPATFLVMPDSRVPAELSGTLAPDFLSRYDVEFDFASARMNLYPQQHCAAPFRGASVPVTLDNANHVIVPVVLDGKTVMASLDTGSSRSDMSLEAAQELFGLERVNPAQGPDVGNGLYRHPFRSLGFGGVAIESPEITLVPEGISRRPKSSARLVIGMGVLRHFRLYIAYSEHTLTLSPASDR